VEFTPEQGHSYVREATLRDAMMFWSSGEERGCAFPGGGQAAADTRLLRSRRLELEQADASNPVRLQLLLLQELPSNQAP